MQRDEAQKHRRCLDWVWIEDIKLSNEARIELAQVRMDLRLEVEAIDAELAVRERMTPTPIAS
jgi:hypothetical protein